MQRILLLTLFIFPTLISYSQFNLETSQVYGGNSFEEAVDIEVNLTSTALFLGARTFSNDGDIPGNNGGSDFWVQKRNFDGSVIWNVNFGGFNNDDLAAVMPHPDGGTLAFGTTRNEHGIYGDLKGLAGGWLIRTNNMGVLTKGRIFGEDVSENGIDAILHQNGNITMAIEASSPDLDDQSNNGILDVWIVRVDASFNILWSTLLGGLRQDSPAAIATDANNNIYVAATSLSNLPGLPANFGEKDLWVFKLGSDGEMLWQKNFGGTGDDIANDIIFDPAGNVFVISHSNSQDGDFNSNYGFTDLWLLKLNAENGDPLLIKKYGGEGIDANGNLGWLETDHLVISATSNSDSFDLSGNKGFNDVWLFQINTAGVIQQEMNYGGSLNDLAGDLIVVDSVIYMYNSTLSRDKNVPENVTTQQDTWFAALNTDPDTCSFQFVCQQDSLLSNELFPPSTEVLVCASGCTAGLQRGPDFIQGSCPDFIYNTAYFKLITDANADLVTLTVETDEFNEPHLALLKTNNCSTFTVVGCGQGSEGRVLLQYVEVEPSTTYIIAVSDAAGNVGDFELCATAVNVEFCNELDKLYVNNTSMGSPLSGPFLPGELVQVCYELLDWNKLDCNGFQGLVPTFGPGWDPEGFDFFGMPVQVDSMIQPVSPMGFWDWYKVGDVHYNINNPIAGFGGGQGMAPGWYFTNLLDAPPNNGPDETTGDIFHCLQSPDKWKVCFTLPVEDECETNMDLSISMRTFSDGELGVNTSLACAFDQEETLNIGMVCCINPTVQNIAERSVCSGDTLIIVPETNIIPPVTYSWMASPETGIEGATSGNEEPRFYQILRNETNDILDVTYTLWAEGINCEADPITFTVHVYPLPTSRITISGPNIVCSGETITLNFESTGTPPYAIEVTRDNQFFANVLSESPFISIEIDPVLSGRFRVGSMNDAFCEGEGLGFVNVTVKPKGTNVIDTAICVGDSITFGNQTFDEGGSYLVTLEDLAANGCDSIISLSLTVNPTLTETIEEMICHGDTIFVLGLPYTETTHEIIEYIGPLGCTNFIELDLVVIDTIIDEFDQTICGGDTLNFEGIAVYETGTYSHVEETTPGCFMQTILNLTVLDEIEVNDVSITPDAGDNDGEILVEFSGGTPPYTFLWSNGQTTGSLFNLEQGDYTVTVTDRNGCTASFEFKVPLETGTTDISEKYKVHLWPTLLSSGMKLYMSYSGADNAKPELITLWRSNGQKCREITISGQGLQSFDLPVGLSQGLYFISLQFNTGFQTWHKIIVE